MKRGYRAVQYIHVHNFLRAPDVNHAPIVVWLLWPSFNTRCWHVRWSSGHQVGQVGFLLVFWFPPKTKQR